MLKEHEVRRPKAAHASCTFWSIAYNVIFVLNLASTPFMAYLTEPSPGAVGLSQPPTWNTFDEYVNAMTAHFQHTYNDATLGPNQVSRRDEATNSYGMRHEMTVPFEIPEDNTMEYILQMPASIFYGHGMRNYITAFLTSNNTYRRQLQPWQMCQHDLILTMIVGDTCIWKYETGPNQYTIWEAASLVETPESTWIKFVFRCLVSGYVMYVLWTRYYRHYIVLLAKQSAARWLNSGSLL
ncbi:hypothetical protein AeRB84_015088 [Aphanomyces euteiches]|nr:hypothetical protein AeRB84_015088 [Aphanomyces euteiches]